MKYDLLRSLSGKDVDNLIECMYVGPVKVHHAPDGDCFVVSATNEWFLCVKSGSPEHMFLSIFRDIESYSYKKICSKAIRSSLYREENDDLYVTLLICKTKCLSHAFSQKRNTARRDGRAFMKGYALSMDSKLFAFMCALLLPHNLYDGFLKKYSSLARDYPDTIFQKVINKYVPNL